MFCLLCCACVFADGVSRGVVGDEKVLALLQLRHSKAQAIRSEGRRGRVCTPSSAEEGRAHMHLIHTPKTAGTSFKADFGLVQNAGNGGMGEHCLMPHGEQNCTVMFFRSPRSHVLSQFYQCADKDLAPPDFSHLPESGLPSDMKTNASSGFPLWLDHFMGPDGQSACPEVPSEEQDPLHAWTSADSEHTSCRRRVDFDCYNPNNMQTRHLVCTRTELWGSHYIGAEGATPDVSAALANLATVELVGITELYPASVCLMKAKLSGTIAEGCACGSAREGWTHEAWHKASYPRPTIETYSEEVQHKVDTITQADRVIYEAALERFVNEIRQVAQAHSVELLCDEDKHKLRSEIEYLPGLADRLGI